MAPRPATIAATEAGETRPRRASARADEVAGTHVDPERAQREAHQQRGGHDVVEAGVVGPSRRATSTVSSPPTTAVANEAPVATVAPPPTVRWEAVIQRMPRLLGGAVLGVSIVVHGGVHPIGGTR